MSKVLYPVHFVNSPEQVTLKFRFQINGVSDPDAIVPANCGVTDVTRTSEGLFAITLDEKFPVFIGATGTVMGTGATSLGMVVQCAPGDYVASTGVLSVSTIDPSEAGTAPETTGAVDDPTDNDWVYIEATFCRKSGLAPSGSI